QVSPSAPLFKTQLNGWVFRFWSVELTHSIGNRSDKVNSLDILSDQYQFQLYLSLNVSRVLVIGAYRRNSSGV
ncbi:hypothetical protein, partial [Vibrio paucivorans]